ncbi:MAG: 3-phosphoshikimate 1-carboxyvinyltransferase [Proteobacteria bacterium]|nr:3-phosphoshikimate 1-carboxyvinyltransferase [Pseudomonadota bacterium]MBU1389595.1 3-phosphoshikimate 1-carboxyvinyltransferase [Pseudomonadota bacterium]MBU1544459.1 3-phosphoshikimate 1-carboxyvinyltransferase [Pseudomonadota bacterium]MBU2481007.1 3-phosphoshikimate 1-carboxyvinyltransferase [Pseudomonadota bacterium]
MKIIDQKKVKTQSVTIPGSKSISHRMLICAALSRGSSLIDNLLHSDDISLTMAALKNLGADILHLQDNNYEVTGFGGFPRPYDKQIYLGNSGTSMRLLAGIAALGNTPYVLTGDERMCERPMKELLDALNMMGMDAVSNSKTGTPPVTITGKNREGGHVKIDCSKSSQYLSALLMMGALLKSGLDISLYAPPVSSPYISLTLDIMKKFNVQAYQIDLTHYRVEPDQTYKPGHFFVEPDLSNAGYFWAIGAITGQMIFVKNISRNSLQGDLKQIDILEKMGCSIQVEDNRIGVCGKDLKAIHVDMGDTPDAVPAIAVVASFAKGTTKITNIHHLREKECDRIDAVSSQLMKLGIQVEQGHDYLCVTGGTHHAATIETFNDHRIAMAFSLPGLIVPGIKIENELCVEKSFPNYWEIFDSL